LAATGLDERRDAGYVDIGSTRKSAAAFLETCAELRYWDRDFTA
jgi:hypothetical protein